VTLASLVFTLPNQEVRFAFPLFALLFAAAAPALARWARPAPAGPAVAAALVLLSLATSTSRDLWPRIAELALLPLVLAALGAALWAVRVRFPGAAKPPLAIAGVVAGLVVVAFVYVEWQAYIDAYYLKGTPAREGLPSRWAEAYGPKADVWEFVRENLPDDATVAVANTYLRYPFYDPGYRRRVVYAPVRPDVADYTRLPQSGDAPIPADRLNHAVTTTMNAGADREAWLANLRASGANFLVIGTMDEEPNPPEGHFVADHRAAFPPLFQGPGGSIYAVNLAR
jgi:hypothetical protein